MQKAQQVNKVLENKGISSLWSVSSDREAISFVVDVLETQSVLGDEKWDEALIEFSKYVSSYTKFMEDLEKAHVVSMHD